MFKGLDLRKKRKFESLFIIGSSLVLSTIFYFWHLKSLTVCNFVAIGNMGDLTTGEIWWNWMVSDSDLTNVNFFSPIHDFANYPTGESFFPLTSINQIFRRSLILVLTNIFGFICAENVFIVIGIFLTLIFTMKLLEFLGKNIILNFFLSLTWTFSPYFWAQVYDHPSLTHGWIYSLFILTLIRQAKFWYGKALPFAVFTFSFFWDPYIFMGLFMLATIFVFDKITRKQKIIFVFLSFFFIIPLVQKPSIFSDILIRNINEIYVYNISFDHFITLDSNSLILNKYFPFYRFQSSNSIIGLESVNFVFPLILLLITYFYLYILKAQRMGIKIDQFSDLINTNLEFRLFSKFFLSFIFIIPFMIFASKMINLDLNFPLRVFSRYSNITFLIIVCMINILYQLLSINRSKMFFKFITGFLVLTQIILSIPQNKRVIDYSDFPRIFTQINSLPDDSVFALYSDSQLIPFAQTYQPIFKRRILNNTLQDDLEPIDSAMAIGDPNSVGIVRKLGADYLMIKESLGSGLIANYFNDSFPGYKISDERFISKSNPQLSGIYSLFKIPKVKKVNNFIQIIDGFHKKENRIFSGMWTSKNLAVLRISQIQAKSGKTNLTLVFGASSNRNAFIRLSQGGNLLYTGQVDSAVKEIRVDVEIEKDIEIFSSPQYPLNPPEDVRIGSIYISSLHVVEMN
jgi:hypothetical protein